MMITQIGFVAFFIDPNPAIPVFPSATQTRNWLWSYTDLAVNSTNPLNVTCTIVQGQGMIQILPPFSGIYSIINGGTVLNTMITSASGSLYFEYYVLDSDDGGKVVVDCSLTGSPAALLNVTMVPSSFYVIIHGQSMCSYHHILSLPHIISLFSFISSCM
jgi:hypothetical protein